MGHLSGDQVVPDEDEVDAVVGTDAQVALDAPQVLGDVRQRVRLLQAVAARGKARRRLRRLGSKPAAAAAAAATTYPPTILSSSHPW